MRPAGARENNFDFIRCFAAFLVIYGHSTSLLGLPVRGLWGAPVSTIGVMIFLSLSGYLVTESWQRDPRLFPFFLKRCLRIFPALILCIVLTACVLGPIVTKLSVRDYFANHLFLDYFENIVLKIRYFLPGVFEDNIYKNAVNGSLWTLPVEFLCYFLVAILALGWKKLHWATLTSAIVGVFLIFLFFKFYYRGNQIILWGTDFEQAIFLIPFFLFGSLFCIIRNKISFRLDITIILIFILMYFEASGHTYVLLFGLWGIIPYITLAFGICSTPILRRWARFGDLSYGIYLYAFPCQQMLVDFSHSQMSYHALVVLTTLCSSILAWCSWHLVERPALALKPRQAAVKAMDVSGVQSVTSASF